MNWSADAKQWAKAYFERNAVPLRRPRVDLIDEQTQIISPGEGGQVRLSGLKADLQDWCAKASYEWSSGHLAVSLDLSNERPTWAKLLSNLSAGSAGSASGIAAAARQGAAAGSGGGGTSTPAPIPLASSTVSGTVKTDIDETDPIVYSKSTVDALLSAANPAPAWGIRGQDMDDGGTTAFDPSDLAPTWQTLWPSHDGNLHFDSAVGGAIQPIAWEQRVVFSTRLKVAVGATITISIYSDNHCRVFLNGTLVGADATSANSFPLGTLTYDLALSAGWNDLLLCHGNGDADTYHLEVCGMSSGAQVGIAALVDRMAGVIPIP